MSRRILTAIASTGLLVASASAELRVPLVAALGPQDFRVGALSRLEVGPTSEPTAWPVWDPDRFEAGMGVTVGETGLGGVLLPLDLVDTGDPLGALLQNPVLPGIDLGGLGGVDPGDLGDGILDGILDGDPLPPLPPLP